ncbi:MAG: DUF475 domain-containing protein [Candidatus Pacearchaeota archaeon]|nr:DUF475 domain-containing protein [Candidatus Pacearchaeota archaeon]
MNFWSIIVIVLGLCLFETISSIDNAIINAQVLSTMQKKYRRWFLIWGMIFAVFVVRGLLPWMIVWATNPSLGPLGALTATFSNNPAVIQAIELSSPILLMGGGIFLLLLFFHWIFLEGKKFGLMGEMFFFRNGKWFFVLSLVILAVLVSFTIKINPMIAVGAAVGSVVFFITYAFKKHAEKTEKNLMKSHISNISKLVYLEVLDASFSIDGVLGAFAFTLSVPLIILGNGLGAFVVRQFTVSNISSIEKYIYLKNGAMYSIFFLGIIMILHGFGFDAPAWLCPIVTFAVVGYFFYKSKKHIRMNGLKGLKRNN